MLNWVLGLLLVGAAAFSVYQSPLLIPTHVIVTGSSAEDRLRVRRIVQTSLDAPILRVDSLALESAILQNPEVEQVSFVRSLMDRPVVEIKNRVPIARIIGGVNAYLAEDGTVFSSETVRSDLPRLYLPKEAFNPSGTLVGTWNQSNLAGLILTIKDLETGKLQLSLDTRGVVVIRFEKFGTVLLGSLADYGTKVQSLQRIMQTKPNLLSEGGTLNIMAPDRPVVSPAKP